MDAASTVATRPVQSLLEAATAHDAKTARTARSRRGGRRRLMRRLLIATDALAIAATMAATLSLSGQNDAWAVGLLLSQGGALLMFLMACGLYRGDEGQIDRQTVDDLLPILRAIASSGFLVLSGALLLGLDRDAMASVVFGAVSVAIALPVLRVVARAAARRHPAYQQRVVIVGAGRIGQLVARKLVSHSEYGLRLVGFVDADPMDLDPALGTEVLGSIDDLATLVRVADIDRIIVAFSADGHDDLLDALEGARRQDVRVDMIPRLFEAVGPNYEVNHLEGLPVLTLQSLKRSTTGLRLKRVLDVLIAGSLMVAATPALLLIAVLVRLDSRGPLLYRGRRVATGGTSFEQLKFRTMRVEWCSGSRYGGVSTEKAFQKLLEERGLADEYAVTQKLRHDPRVTRIGRILRRTSLDELPQLFNVLRGDLSLVGPRPITNRERMERYHDAERGPRPGYWDRDGMRPGLTGWWQINGRSTMSFDERIRLDTVYLNNWSLGLDIQILAKTARALVSTSGAY